MLKIDKNVPLNGKRVKNTGEWHSFLETLPAMKIGESILVKEASNYRLAMSIAQCWLKKTYTSQKQNDGKIRIFRTA